jgi:hypothetical protein
MTGMVRAIRPVDDDHRVVSVEGDGGYRRQPCGGCPWRVDQTGEFPAEAFAVSAPTAYDMADRMFGCHESGADRPKTCAGFLLRGAIHNKAVRIAVAAGRLDMDTVTDGGHVLHADYRAMAVANGVVPDDPRIARCRGAR